MSLSCLPRASVGTAATTNDATASAILTGDTEIQANETATTPDVHHTITLKQTGLSAAVHQAHGRWVLGGVVVEAIWDGTAGEWDLEEDGMVIYTGTDYDQTQTVSISQITKDDWVYAEASVRNELMTPVNTSHVSRLTISGDMKIEH